MFGSEILEIAIGLILVYSVLALICSALGEWVARILALRASTLEAGIRNILADPDGNKLAKDIYAHPLVKALSKKGWCQTKVRPSNIPARTFALALFDTVMEAGSGPPSPSGEQPVNDLDVNGKSKALQDNARETFKALEERVESMSAPQEVKKALRAILASAKSESDQWDKALAKARNGVENWFDDSMDRVSGWYKRKIQYVVLFFAIGLSFALNVDTFVIANTLSKDATLREVVVSAAAERVQNMDSAGDAEAPPEEISDTINRLRGELDQLGLPIGWTFTTKKDKNASSEDSDSTNMDAGTVVNDPRDYPNDLTGWLVKVAGILFTGFAVSLGAPFWFDILSKFVNLRGGGGKPQKSPEPAPAGGSSP